MFKKLKNSEKGSVTVLVLTAMLLVVGVVLTIYLNMMNKTNSQAKQLNKIQEEYNKTAGAMDQAYYENAQNNNEETGGEGGEEGGEDKPSTDIALKEGDWVYYVDANNTTRKCVVLWDKNSGYGTQIITMEVVRQVSLGNGTGNANSTSTYFNIAKSSYNEAISYLNQRADTYLKTVYASSVRCVGSNPANRDSESGYSGEFKGGDNNYSYDTNQMNKLGILNINSAYWLASRNVSTTYGTSYSIYYIDSNSSSPATKNICVNNYSSTISYDYSCGLRPVFILKDNVTTTGGSGTQSDPYYLGI